MIRRIHSWNYCEPFWEESFIGSKIFPFNFPTSWIGLREWDYCQAFGFIQSAVSNRSECWQGKI